MMDYEGFEVVPSPKCAYAATCGLAVPAGRVPCNSLSCFTW